MNANATLKLMLMYILLMGLQLYKSVRFYVKKARGDYEKQQAEVVDHKFYTNHKARCDEGSLPAFYRNIYQYMENGEYKIYEGRIHPFMLRFYLLKKGERAFLYRELKSGSIVEKPDTMEGVVVIAPLLGMIVLLFFHTVLL